MNKDGTGYTVSPVGGNQIRTRPPFMSFGIREDGGVEGGGGGGGEEVGGGGRGEDLCTSIATE